MSSIAPISYVPNMRALQGTTLVDTIPPVQNVKPVVKRNIPNDIEERNSNPFAGQRSDGSIGSFAPSTPYKELTGLEDTTGNFVNSYQPPSKLALQDFATQQVAYENNVATLQQGLKPLHAQRHSPSSDGMLYIFG